MRWIRNAASCCHKESPGAKASAANRLIKRIARIQRIRGNQGNNLTDVFIALFMILFIFYNREAAINLL